MKDKDQEGKTTNKLGSLCSTFGLLLSVMCCIALIHVEIRIQEQHRLISHSVRSCDQLETKILRKVQRNNARWQLEQYTINEGHLQHSGGYGDNISRKKRASDNSMKQTSLLTVSEIKLLVKQELGLLQNQICAKDKTLCQTGAKGNEGRRGRPGIRGKPGSPGKQGPPGKLGPEGPPGKHGPMGPQGTIGIKGDLGEPGVRGPLGQTGPPGNKGAKGEPGQSIAGIKGDLGEPGEPGPEGPTGPPGLKGVKGEPGQSLSAPSLLHSPVRTTVNQSQTVTLKCTADGNPAPKITWSKLNSSLPVGRHVVKPSGALIIKDARPDDEGVYSCRAESVLGRVNVSAKLTVQFAPLILLSSKTLWAEEEQNVTIACNTTGRPQPTITWSKAVGRLPTEKTKVKRGTLTIYTVEKTDRGTYICKAENILGSITASTQLTIVSRLQFKVRPPQAVTPASFGSTVQLPCLAESDLRTTVTWTKDGKSSLPDGSHILSNGTLLLQNIKKEHKGTYTCSAANELSTIEANIRVNTPLGPAKSCSEIQKFINNASGNYIIDPDGTGGLAPFTVYCDTTDKNGVGVTVISHDSETRTLVTGCYSQGCYSRDIHYTGASLSQLASLTRVSSQCEQFIRYECYDSVLLYNNNPYGWWVSRDSTKMRYWGGASVNGKCACGMTNSCANPNYGCNCDKQDTVWREDSGMLTDKARLPVKQLRFGDIGGRDKGYHTLGKLKCYGSS